MGPDMDLLFNYIRRDSDDAVRFFTGPMPLYSSANPAQENNILRFSSHAVQVSMPELDDWHRLLVSPSAPSASLAEIMKLAFPAIFTPGSRQSFHLATPHRSLARRSRGPMQGQDSGIRLIAAGPTVSDIKRRHTVCCQSPHCAALRCDWGRARLTLPPFILHVCVVIGWSQEGGGAGNGKQGGRTSRLCPAPVANGSAASSAVERCTHATSR